MESIIKDLIQVMDRQADLIKTIVTKLNKLEDQIKELEKKSKE